VRARRRQGGLEDDMGMLMSRSCAWICLLVVGRSEVKGFQMG
jgi:hypothetical protein